MQHQTHAVRRQFADGHWSLASASLPVDPVSKSPGMTITEYGLLAASMISIPFTVDADGKIDYFVFVKELDGTEKVILEASISAQPFDVDRCNRTGLDEHHKLVQVQALYSGRETVTDEPHARYKSAVAPGGHLQAGVADLVPDRIYYYYNFWAPDGKAHPVCVGHNNSR